MPEKDKPQVMQQVLLKIGMLSFVFATQVQAQESVFQSTDDSVYLRRLADRMNVYFFLNPDSTIYYAEKIMQLPEHSGNREHIINARQMAGEAYRTIGDLPKSLALQLRSIRESRQYGFTDLEGKGLSFVGFTYLFLGFSRQALQYILPARKILENSKDTIHASFNASNASFCYTELGILDSARFFIDTSMRLFHAAKTEDGRTMPLRTLILFRTGRWFEKKGILDSAKVYYRMSALLAQRDGVPANAGTSNNSLARIFMDERRYDSALFFAGMALSSNQQARIGTNYLESTEIMAKSYQALGKPDSALRYLELATSKKDSIFGPVRFRELQVLMAEEQEHQQVMEAERIGARNRQRMILMAVALGIFVLLTLILRRNNKIKQALNQQLTDQKESLEATLDTLRATQKQLIQSEKMASLGELTAGIAHEIQNPLNFVNNFSDLNREMLDELQDTLKKGDLREASVLAENIKENEAKINLHGKRADSIVKNMLQHSRSSSGAKEPKDVNRLVEEYVRLAFHGYRARQKDFNVKLDIDLDPLAGAVHMVAQDIGRVILNLLNNAFYAVQEKAKTAGEGYEPMVTIRTRRIPAASNIGHPGLINIEIRDNGPGIPDVVKEKIFQPFFTTKPTGQGTGLGLSLSYDIVTKGHGGTLQADSEAGQGTLFTVSLPTA